MDLSLEGWEVKDKSKLLKFKLLKGNNQKNCLFEEQMFIVVIILNSKQIFKLRKKWSLSTNVMINFKECLKSKINLEKKIILLFQNKNKNITTNTNLKFYALKKKSTMLLWLKLLFNAIKLKLKWEGYQKKITKGRESFQINLIIK